jgi:integrase
VRPKKRSDDLTYKALTDEEWGAVLDAIEALPRQTDRDRKHYHRARWIMQLLYRAFLRRNEAATLTMDCFIPGPDRWELLATGKGTEKRIIATTALMDELRLYRTFLGMSPYPLPNETTPAIMAVTGHERGVTAQAIYLICKVIYEKAASLQSEHDRAIRPQGQKSLARGLRQAVVQNKGQLEAGLFHFTITSALNLADVR